jgi:phage-related protein (TIGR01555 family)
LQDCIKWGRLYGGAVAYIDIAGQDSAEELRTATIKKGQFVGLRVYDRWHVAPILSSLIPTGPNAGLPELYAVYNIGSESMKRGEPVLKIHHSRLIRQVGIQLPAFQAAQEEYWGESVVERMLDRLISFDTATAGAANLIQKAYLRTVKINKLREILSAGGKPEENLLKMFGHMRLLQTSEGLTLLDKEDEFSAGSYTFTGLPEVILQFGQQISGASGIPLVKFFGQSPVGMNATGESDLRLYYDNINSKQEANLREGIDRLLAVVYRSTLGRDKPESADFDFVPLWQTSQAEKVSIAKSITESITMAFEKGVIGEPTALKELKQASDYSGVFSNITSEEIDAASEKEPPIPEGMDEPVAIELGGDEPEGEQPEKNGAFDRIKRLIGRG